MQDPKHWTPWRGTFRMYTVITSFEPTENAARVLFELLDLWRPGETMAARTAVGFPLQSLWADDLWGMRSRVLGGLVVPEIVGMKGDHVLPLRPFWPGFAANTAIYALLAWSAGALISRTRRAFRRRRGLCPRCAYELRSVPHEVCSECGFQA